MAEALRLVLSEDKEGTPSGPRAGMPFTGVRGPYDDKTGRTFGAWKVLGWTGRTGGRPHGAVWSVESVCCGRKEERSTHGLLTTSSHSKCRKCAAEESRKHPGAPRNTCVWCGKQWEPTPGRRVLNECMGCERAGQRNGREADGRPIRVPAHESVRRGRATIAAKRAAARALAACFDEGAAPFVPLATTPGFRVLPTMLTDRLCACGNRLPVGRDKHCSRACSNKAADLARRLREGRVAQ